MEHIVMFSGGAGSFVAARRVSEMFTAERIVLLTADTRSEHDSWYTFVRRASADLEQELVVVSDGRDVWELARDEHAIPNDRMPFCSRELKYRPIHDYLNANHSPENSVLYFGIDWTEERRITGICKRNLPWTCDFPLLWEPLVDKQECIEAVAQYELPAYLHGLPHNNCLKYGCVRGGKAYWAKLLREMPETFNRTVLAEQNFRNEVSPHTLLHDETLSQLRIRVTSETLSSEDNNDWGACGCLE